MAKLSERQKINIERYKRIGWERSHRGEDKIDAAVLPQDFDPPARDYLAEHQLKTILTPTFKE